MKKKQEIKSAIPNETTTNPEMSDEDYWKQFDISYEEGHEELMESMQNHEISLDVSIKYSNCNGILFETHQKNINCNIPDLNDFFTNLKKTIRMVDESIADDSTF